MKTMDKAEEKLRNESNDLIIDEYVKISMDNRDWTKDGWDINDFENALNEARESERILTSSKIFSELDTFERQLDKNYTKVGVLILRHDYQKLKSKYLGTASEKDGSVSNTGGIANPEGKVWNSTLITTRGNHPKTLMPRKKNQGKKRIR